MKDSRAAFTGPQTYGMNEGVPVAFANRLAELEKRVNRRQKRVRKSRR